MFFNHFALFFAVHYIAHLVGFSDCVRAPAGQQKIKRRSRGERERRGMRGPEAYRRLLRLVLCPLVPTSRPLTGSATAQTPPAQHLPPVCHSLVSLRMTGGVIDVCSIYEQVIFEVRCFSSLWNRICLTFCAVGYWNQHLQLTWCFVSQGTHLQEQAEELSGKGECVYGCTVALLPMPPLTSLSVMIRSASLPHRFPFTYWFFA